MLKTLIATVRNQGYSITPALQPSNISPPRFLTNNKIQMSNRNSDKNQNNSITQFTQQVTNKHPYRKGDNAPAS